MSPKAKSGNLLDRVREIALSLPDTKESSRLGGSPHFYVRGKIGVWSFGAKVGLELQSLLIEREGIHVAKYVGRYGWISVDESALQDEAEMRQLIELSYDLISAKAPGGNKKVAKKIAKQGAKKAAKK